MLPTMTSHHSEKWKLSLFAIYRRSANSMNYSRVSDTKKLLPSVTLKPGTPAQKREMKSTVRSVHTRS